ncbi:hypothetical protein JCM17960_34590 [Magnetospira thiophila]
MSTAVPPPTSGPPPPPLPPLPPLTLPLPPPALLKLPIGTLLQAFNLPKAELPTTASGPLLQIQTPGGSVQVPAAWPLPPGAQLTLALDTLHPQVLLRLVSVNGKPATPALLAQLAQGKPSASGPPLFAPQPGGSPTAGAAGASPFSGPVVVARGEAILATVLRPAFAPTPASAPVPAPTGGAPTTAAPTPGATSAPQPATGPAPGPLFPGARVPQAASPPPATPAPSAASPPASGPSLTPGTQIQVRILATAPPNTPLPPATPAPGHVVLAGTILGNSAIGQPVVETKAGPLALQTRIALPQGTQVLLETAPLTSPPVRSGDTAPLPIDPLGREWPALKETLASLQQMDPAAAQRFLDGILPKPTAQLGAQLLFFMSALRGGDVRAWLGGDASRALAARRPDLLDRLGDDVKTMGRAAAPSPSADWRLYGLPMFDGQELSQIRLMVRDHPSEDDPKEGRDTQEETRFIIDVDLSRMGRLQMDGLVRPGDRRFDLILRTVSPLAAEVRDHIRELFRDSSEITGFIGGISFQIGGGFVEPPSEARHAVDPRALGLDV